MNRYTVEETIGQRLSQVAYVVKVAGEKEALLRVFGHGPDAKRNAEMVCAALNATLASQTYEDYAAEQDEQFEKASPAYIAGRL